nr:MAG TPA: tail protein [Caudoviricetes sp.]
MKAESLYIQKLTYDENTGNEIIGLFPSEANPAIVSSYTYDAKRMGGAPTLTATIYSSEPLQWKKEEFVEYNGDRFFASYTPNSTKDNSSRMWKSEITFTSRRELLDNTLFFDVVVDDVDTHNKDRYRSNQTKFTFGGTIHEFVARVNSSMAYCGLYRPTDEYKGYYVVVDEGYGTDEVKEVSFEDQYLTDVLQLINTTFELDYYWDGSVCHVGKVQHDLTDTPIKYGSSDALISVSKENANYKIVDMITGYGSSDNLPYYYPNDDEFGEAIFDAKNIASEHVDVTLSDYLRYSKYNDNLVLFKSKKGKYEGNVDVSTLYVRDTYSPENLTQADNSQNPKVKCWFWVSIKINVKKGQIIDFSKISFNFELFDYIQKKENITNLSSATRTINIYTTYHDLYKNVCTDSNLGDACSVEFAEDGTFYIDIDAIFSYNCKVFTMDGKRTFHGSSAWKVSFSGDVVFSLDTNSEYSWKNGDNYIPLDNSGIYVNGIASAKYVEYDYNFGKNDEGIYGFDKIYTGTEDDAVQVSVTGRKWIAPSSVLMPSIYRNTKGAERFYYALNNAHKLPSGSGYYEFVNLYKKGNPHQGTVTFDGIKPTIKGIVNAEGQLFGEIVDVAFDSVDSDVKDSDGKYIHSYFYIKLHKFNGDFGFDLFAHALASEPAKINLIKSNGCPACSFVIYNQPSADNSKCYNCVSVDENGNLKPVRTDKNDYIFANASDAYEDKLNQDSTQKELWIAVQKDTSTLGIIMPNASAGFKPQKGDLFVITGIKPPKVLVTAAEKRLDDALIKNMSENNTDQFNYSVKFSRIFLQENHDFASKLNENAKLSIQIQGDSDSDGNLISHEVFVSNYSVKVDNDELAEVEIELVNSLEVTKSDTKQIVDAVKGETVKSLSSMVGGSNTNSFNASITDKMYLSKLKDDTAKGTITWEKVQKFLQGILIGNNNAYSIDANGNAILSDVIVKLLKSLDFNEAEQSGFAIKQRSDGKYQMLLTDLIVWGKAIFNTLLIRELSYVGGNIVLSPAAGKISYIKEVYSETTNEMIGWKCYLLADDGTTATINSFKVEDQVRCKTFNIAPSVYENVSNRDYWRLVTKVSTENEAITDDEGHELYDGKKFAWIQIAKDNCMEGSDNPAVGDTIVLMGNRSDKSRQHLLMMETEGDSAPRFTMYRGINTYSLKDKSIFDVSFDGINIVSKYFNMVSVSGEKVWTPVYRGDWKEGTEYSYYDEVTWLGTRWLCISQEGQTTTDEPSEESPYWKATTNIYKPKVILYTDIVYSGISIGETHNITCKLMLGDKDVSNGVASWKVTRKTGDSLDDAAWATKDKVKNFNGSIDIVWSNDGTEDDIGKGNTATFTFTATTTTGKIHQEYIKV